jgi:hypothetical protein
MSRPKKRKVNVRFASNNPEDPLRTLQAVEDVFRPAEIDIEVGSRQRDKDDAKDLETTERRIKDEQLETRSRREAQRVLKEKADSENAERSAKGIPPDAREPKSPKEIVTLRKRVMECMKGLAAGAWCVTVQAVLDWIKNQGA